MVEFRTQLSGVLMVARRPMYCLFGRAMSKGILCDQRTGYHGPEKTPLNPENALRVSSMKPGAETVHPDKTQGQDLPTRDLPALRPFRSENVPAPRLSPGWLDWESPIDLEIGCGAGLHPILYGREHPQRSLIAIEHTLSRFKKFQRRLEHHPDIQNVTPVHANAIGYITHFVPPRSLDRVFILYPNPHPKKRHEHRRWYAMPFMERILDSLVVGGELTMATNIRSYAERATLFLTEIWNLESVARQELHRDHFDPQLGLSHFERKYLETGHTCIRETFRVSTERRIGRPSPPESEEATKTSGWRDHDTKGRDNVEERRR
jgi:tRNA (guanine-N7-)-methyltransferase